MSKNVQKRCKICLKYDQITSKDMCKRCPILVSKR